MKKVFIDGRAGTTGLRIFDRLSSRPDIELITLSEEDRKNPVCRKKAINEANVAFLCLPDDAARESVSLVENPDTVIIDTSTAHRTNPDWAYGFPELSEKHEEKLLTSKRIAVPGCHASGFIALVYPLVEAGFISKDTLLTCFSITGYSGGGKNMIASYEDENRDKLLDSPRQYGLTQQHKHLKEMVAVTGINSAPVFCPVVSSFYSGMEVTVPLFASQLLNGKTAEDIKKLYAEKYANSFVRYEENADENGFMASNVLSDYDNMQICVAGNKDRILLIARYDNLGKGASGAAVECMNIAIGENRTTGLNL